MNGNVIELDKKSNYRFVIVRHSYERDIRNGSIKDEQALILYKNMKNGKNIVHPFTEYIITEYRHSKIKTQIDNGSKIVTFLNYILDNCKRLRVDNFCSLNYEHASIFLNYYCGILKTDTALRYLKELSKFYYFLAKRNILDDCNENDFKINKYIGTNAKEMKRIIAPFPNIKLPKRDVRSRNEHDMPPELQGLLMEVAIEEVNRIALGVALQMFGGVRMGELICLTYSSIRTIGYYGENGLILKIQDRVLREDLKNNSGKGFAKRQRYQQALSPFGFMGWMFKRHKIKYHRNKNCDAIFINRNGDPMSYESYKYYFNVLKKKFLDRLEESENPVLKSQALVLRSKRWLTHIGRGIFSNNLVQTMSNSSEIQALRGDTNINSHYVYIADSRRLGKKFEENIENLYSQMIEKYSK